MANVNFHNIKCYDLFRELISYNFIGSYVLNDSVDSNIGAERISNITLEHWKSGMKREDLNLKSIEPVLRKVVYNVEGKISNIATK